MRVSDEQREQMNSVALEEYRRHAGKLLEVGYICGYTSDGDGSNDCACVPPIIVRVTVNQNRHPHQGLLHWNDEWLDPYWDVELVSGNLPKEACQSIWIDGPSHNAETGAREWNDVRVLTPLEALRVRLRCLWRKR